MVRKHTRKLRRVRRRTHRIKGGDGFFSWLFGIKPKEPQMITKHSPFRPSASQGNNNRNPKQGNMAFNPLYVPGPQRNTNTRKPNGKNAIGIINNENENPRMTSPSLPVSPRGSLAENPPINKKNSLTSNSIILAGTNTIRKPNNNTRKSTSTNLTNEQRAMLASIGPY
jgi:hypothetical protein